MAAHLWVLAELIRSFDADKLRIIPLAAACAVAIFVRYDSALLAIPIAVGGFMIHRPMDALKRGLALVLLVAVPLGAWAARSAEKGLGFVPQFYFVASGGPMPVGYFSWGKTWTTSQYEGPSWVYAVYIQKIQSNPPTARRLFELARQERN